MTVERTERLHLSQVKTQYLSIFSDKILHLSVTTSTRIELEQAVAITNILFSTPYIV